MADYFRSFPEVQQFSGTHESMRKKLEKRIPEPDFWVFETFYVIGNTVFAINLTQEIFRAGENWKASNWCTQKFQTLSGTFRWLYAHAIETRKYNHRNQKPKMCQNLTSKFCIMSCVLWVYARVNHAHKYSKYSF